MEPHAIHWLTLIASAAFLLCKFSFVSRKEAIVTPGNPVIRGDLFLIYPTKWLPIINRAVQSIPKNPSKE